jgi:glycosyltransferase involved in cell wall biosynthesis
MKIVILSTFYPFRGGIAQFNASIFRCFEKNHSVKAINFKRQYPNILFPGKSQYVDKDDVADAIPSVALLDSINPITFRKTAREINNFEPDLIISRFWMSFFGPALGTVLKKTNKEAIRIAILDNVIPHEGRFFDKPATKYFLNRNDGFVVMSDKVLNDLLSLKPDAKYLRIDHPVYDHFGEHKDREETLTKYGLSVDKKYVLFFGFIRDYKGLDLLIEAMSHLDESIELLIAGEVYGSFDRYDKMLETSTAKDRIHLFTRYVSDSEVSDFFSMSDACILPYKDATQSGITAISNHFNLPIIATDVGGLKEKIEHEKTGLIVEKPEPELIAKSIAHYFQNDLKAGMSENIEIEKKKHSWEGFTEKLIEFSQTL